MNFAQLSKRFLLFFAVNALVMLTVGVLLSVFNVRQRIGDNYFFGLLVFCLIWGMAGAFISLALSRTMAKWSMGVQVIDPATADPEARNLVEIVRRLAQRAGLPAVPEVGIYNSPEINAFATGPSKSRALVSVSSGLLEHMRTSDVEGVLGHEIAHVANGDMVTMTLIQGIVNSLAMFLAYVLAIALSQRSSRDEDERGGGSMMQWLLVQVFQMVFMFLGMLVVRWFSRWREYRADAGGAQFAGRDKMISALKSLKAAHDQGADAIGPQQPAFQALKISGKSTFALLLADHPPIDDRIARLESMRA